MRGPRHPNHPGTPWRAWHPISHHPRLAIVLALIVVSGLVVALLILPRAATYSVSAVSEIARIQVRDELGVKARLPSVELVPRGMAASASYCCPLTLWIPNHAVFNVARKRDGDLDLEIESVGSSTDPPRLDAADGSPLRTLESHDTLKIRLSRPASSATTLIPDTVLLAFRGELKLGDDAGPLVQRILLSGTVRVVERATGGTERYVVHEATLDPGDSLRWEGASRQEAAPIVSGFIHVGENEALQVTALAAAHGIRVNRFGAPPYLIKPSPIDRWAHDPLLTLIGTTIVTAGALAAILEAILNVFDRLQGKRGPPSHDHTR